LLGDLLDLSLDVEPVLCFAKQILNSYFLEESCEISAKYIQK
jgi:hypothetical protein